MNITAIIAHKDYNEYLKDAIQSCIEQTIPINYIVVDDGSKIPPSPPKDFKYIKDGHYSQDNNHFIYLHSSSGPSNARNVAINIAKEYTDYFQILDSDDIMMPNKCERLLQEFNHPQIGVSYADYFIECNGIKKMEFKKPYTRTKLFESCIVHSGAMVSKEAFEYINEDGNYYDPRLRTCEDYLCWLKISEKFMIKHVPQFLTIVRDHEFNSTNTVASQTWQQNMQLVRHIIHERNFNA